MRKVKLSLLQNANSFIEEALSKAILAENKTLQWKFAILSLVQAIELAIKERLRREHQVLIFSDIDNPKNTVNITVAFKRLKNICGITITEKEAEAIHNVKQWRNLIVHSEFAFKAHTAKIAFATLLGFLEEFNRKHLDLNLQEILPEELWDEALSINDFYKELVKRAEIRLNEEEIDIELIWDCRQCGWHGFVIQDEINTCYLCGYKYDEIVECVKCGGYVYLDESEGMEVGDMKHHSEIVSICKGCIEDMMMEDSMW